MYSEHLMLYIAEYQKKELKPEENKIKVVKLEEKKSILYYLLNFFGIIQHNG